MPRSSRDVPSGSANSEHSTDTPAQQPALEAAEDAAQAISDSLDLDRPHAEVAAVRAVASSVIPMRFNPQYSEYSVDMPPLTTVGTMVYARSLQNKALTEEGRALAPHLVALPGVVTVTLKECKISITKAEVFTWDQVDAELLPLLRGEASTPAPIPMVIRHIPAPNPEAVVVQSTVQLAAPGSIINLGIGITPGETVDDILRTANLEGESVATRSLLADLASLPGIRSLTISRYEVMVVKHPDEPTERLVSAIEARLTAYAEHTDAV